MTVAPFAQVLAELGSFGHFQGAAADTAEVPQLPLTPSMFTQVFMVLDGKPTIVQ